MDGRINLFMESIENPVFTFISKFLDLIFNPEFLIILGVIISGYFFYKKFWKKGIVIFSLFISTGILVNGLKELFMRNRPHNALIESAGYSLPSGHIAVSVVFFGIFLYLLSLKKQIKFKIISCVLFFILIFIIGFSRIYLRVHWFTDVLAGLLVGSVVLVLGIIVLSLKKFSFY